MLSPCGGGPRGKARCFSFLFFCSSCLNAFPLSLEPSLLLSAWAADHQGASLLYAQAGQKHILLHFWRCAHGRGCGLFCSSFLNALPLFLVPSLLLTLLNVLGLPTTKARPFYTHPGGTEGDTYFCTSRSLGVDTAVSQVGEPQGRK